MAGTINTRRASRNRKMQSQINVTPFVDVMLVLLIVFMITAPLLTVGVPVELPKSTAPEITGDDEPLAVSIDAAGLIYLQDTEIDLEELGPRLVAVTERNPDARIFVHGDESIDYGMVMAVMGALADAGFTNLALITQLPGNEAR